MPRMPKMNVGDKVLIKGKPVTGTKRLTTQDGEGPVESISGFIYFVEEGGRGWKAVNAYIMDTPALEAEVIQTKYGQTFLVAKKHIGQKAHQYAQNPYARKSDGTAVNVKIYDYGHEVDLDSIREDSAYGISRSEEFGCHFTSKNIFEVL